MHLALSHKIFIVVMLATPLFAFGYDDVTTHPALADETVDLFDSYYPNLKLNPKEKDLVKKGSIEEDAASRWMQHFYDPVYNRGLFGFEASPLWAEDTFSQAINDAYYTNKGNVLDNLDHSYFDSRTDYSWDRAVYDYVWGDKSRGLVALGHILHLIADASVPDHTRNDPHPPVLDFGSPYEAWTAQFTPEKLNGLSTAMYHTGLKPPAFSSLYEYFNSLATYSNNNFFSKDSTPNKTQDYNLPIIQNINRGSNGRIYGYTLDENTKLYKLIILVVDPNNSNNLIPLFTDDAPMLTDYWSHLSKQAILHGVGVMKLFFEAAEKERQNKVLWAKNRSTMDNMASIFPIFFGKPPQPISNISSIPDQSFVLVAAPPQIDRSPTSINSTSLQTTVDLTDVGLKNNSGLLPPQEQNTASDAPPVGFGGGMPLPVQASQTNGSLLTVLPTDKVGEAGPNNPDGSRTSINNATTSDATVYVDSTAPDVVLNIAACGNSFSKDACIIATSTFAVSWYSFAEDLDHYEITCRKDNAPCSNFSMPPNATSTIFAGEDNSNYTFSVKAVDKNGNIGGETSKTISVSSNPIAISEVAWAGTAANSNDEWIELYNKTSAPIPLNGWALYAKNTFKPYIKLSGSIAGGSYYLLERKDDNAVSDVTADLIYGNGSASWALNDNPADVLVLSYASTTMEETPLCFGNRWCGGSQGSPRTSMERIDFEVSASDPNNWGTSNGMPKNGKDANGDDLQATPRARNSLDYLLFGNLNKDKTLKRGQMYVVAPRWYFSVPAGVTLNIEPGVIIKIGSSSGIQISGSLQALGASDEPIIFTSLYDDFLLGDTDGDGGATKPFPGSWERIIFDSKTQTSVIKNTHFMYGGRWYNNVNDNQRSMVSILGATTSISNSIFEKSYGAGLMMSSSDSEINSNLFSENTMAGLQVWGGAPIISKNTFSKNAGGLTLESSLATVDQNIFNSNISNAIYSYGTIGSFTENSGTGNGQDAIALFGGVAAPNATATLIANPLPYSTLNGAYYNISVAKGAGLEINKDVIFKGGSESSIIIDGTLHIDGVNPNDILLNSSLSDLPGQWKGILVNPNGVIYGGGFTLKNAGGAPSSCRSICAGFKINGGSAELANAKIEKNYYAGMRLDNATATLTNFEFNEHQLAALVANNSNVTLNGISFTNNGLAVSALASIINAIDIIFTGNTTTTSPPGLF